MPNPSQADHFAVQRGLDDRSEFKQRVLSAVNIVEVIGSSVVLKKRGKDYSGLCPFHQEKTPSFTVSPAKQMFYCYGCKAGGDVITFVMKRDRLEFRDALEALGRAAGIQPPQRVTKTSGGSDRQRWLDANAAAAAFFENSLNSEAGAPARDYLRQRGFNDAAIKQFRIGFAPDAWEALLRSPLMRKFPPPLLATAGLVKPREGGGGFYDVFRNRLIFPIRSDTGQTIAFGGRAMPGSPKEIAKYLNSPETPLFSKGRSIFGIDLAKQRIVERQTAVVVEGYTDVAMAHQFGVKHVVSVLGTAMTEQHVSALRKFADKIVLLFDADTAGDIAADRVVELFLTQPVEIAIASMPAGMDPDELLLQRGAEAFEAVLSEAADVLTYKWRQFSRQFASEAGDLTGQQKAVQQYMELLAAARGAGPVDPLRWGQALARVSRLTEMPIDELNRRFKTRKKPRRQVDFSARRYGNIGPAASAPAPPRQTAGGWPPGAGDMAPAASEIPPELLDGSAEAGVPGQGAEIPRSERYLNARDRAERWILGALLLKPPLWQRAQVKISAEDFVDPLRRKLAETYWTHQREEGEPVFAEMLGNLSDPLLAELAVGLVDEIEELIGDAQEPQVPIVAKNEARTHKARPVMPLEAILASALEYLERERQQRMQQKQFALLRRTSDDHPQGAGGDEPEPALHNASAAIDQSAVQNDDPNTRGDESDKPPRKDQAALFAEFVKNNQSTNLHRLGPIRRARS